MFYKKVYGHLLLKNYFSNPPSSSSPSENPKSLNLLICLTPPSVLGLETWVLFYFVQNLPLYNSTIPLYLSCMLIFLVKCFFFTFSHKSFYELRDSPLSDRTFVESYILNKIKQIPMSLSQKLKMVLASEC